MMNSKQDKYNKHNTQDKKAKKDEQDKQKEQGKQDEQDGLAQTQLVLMCSCTFQDYRQKIGFSGLISSGAYFAAPVY